MVRVVSKVDSLSLLGVNVTSLSDVVIKLVLVSVINSSKVVIISKVLDLTSSVVTVSDTRLVGVSCLVLLLTVGVYVVEYGSVYVTVSSVGISVYIEVANSSCVVSSEDVEDVIVE